MPDWMSANFMPHGHCWLWSPQMLALQISTNAAIGLSYFAIALTLAYLVAQIRDIPFRWMYLAFGVFIVTCGVTHFLDVWVIWHPDYWIDGGVRAVTAVASVGTAVLLPPLVPKAIAVAQGAKAAHDRGMKLETIVEDLARSYEKAQELDRLKTSFFANMSHELRTPLSLILGPTERLLASDGLDADVRRELEVVRRNARTLLRNVDDLLDVAKLEAKQEVADLREADLAGLVRAAVAHFDAFAAERNVTVTVEAPAALPARLDTRKIDRVVLNLLSNAFKFTPAGGRVRVALAAADGEARLEVCDSGPGVPADLRTAVFERFRQVHGGAARPFGGTGLGLAIVKEFVELHGGTVAADAAPEGGACFRVALPVGRPGEGAMPANERDPSGPPLAETLVSELRETRRPLAPAPEAGGSRVLVVEDNPDLRDLLARALGEAGFTVATAADGAEGYALCGTWRPDTVVTDVMMPGVTGEDLVQRLRAERATVPVLVLSAITDEDRRISLLQAGADDYVVKPFRMQELETRVRRLVAEKRARDVLRADLAGREGDIATLVTELSARTREVERASALKTTFLRMVSHELRSPIHALALQIAVLKRDPARASQLAESQTRTLRRLQGMVDALLLHTQIEAGRLQVSRSPVPVLALAEEVVGHLADDARDRRLEVSAGGDRDAVAQTDARLLRVVLTNLVGNAVKFTSTGSVTVAVKAEPEAVTVDVRDTGPGIPPEDQARIFSPFEQVADAAHKHEPGLGLGLSLVAEFMRALGGSVTLVSEVGRGSTFTVRLPREAGWPERS